MELELELEWEDLFVQSIFCIGLFIVVRRVFNLLSWLHSAFFRSSVDLTKYGSWAVVTGCTDGIGKALALDLASIGLNLFLIGRNKDKLEATRAEISHQQKLMNREIGIRCCLVDLAESTGEEVENRIKEAIEGLDVGLLINNAGVAYPYARFFDEVDLKLMESVMRVNVEAATWITRAVLPCMIKKGRGFILNVGSASSECLPSYPLYSVYSATKAYLAMFSRSLSLEYGQHGIDIQCQVPFLVATKLAAVESSSLFVPSTKEYSRASIQWLGNGSHTFIPYWPHYLQSCLLELIPDFLVNGLTFRSLASMRARGICEDAKLTTAFTLSHNNM